MDTTILWNPAIRKSIILPKSRVHFGPYEPCMFCLGFGFDENNSEFNVVRIAYLQDGDERFSEMGLPKRVTHVSPLDLSVTLRRDQFFVVWYTKGCDKDEFCDRCVVFGMNRYGEMESCTKKFVLVLGNGISLAIGFGRNGEFLIGKCVGHLPSYDPERKEFKDLGIHGGKDSFFLDEYTESPVLLDGNQSFNCVGF
ncbi:hypothetical protein T459_05159 [Capsicum annuum]|uniref:Uncharacterized protein n=1 Tax=Capsicum annuum TaxID=4072 RepID=A0A2G3A724_CAPAN|nr:hypothetical protein T459_05159 [Capsicum annuum]